MSETVPGGLAPSSARSARVEGPARRPPTPKPVRHRRWRRAATAVTAVAILGFGALTFGFLRRQQADVGVAATRTVLTDLARTVGEYHRRNRLLPEALSKVFDPSLRYEGDVVPEDAWRGPIEYRVVDAAAGTFRLRSRGPDRLPDTADDLVWPVGAAFPAP